MSIKYIIITSDDQERLWSQIYVMYSSDSCQKIVVEAKELLARLIWNDTISFFSTLSLFSRSNNSKFSS